MFNLKRRLMIFGLISLNIVALLGFACVQYFSNPSTTMPMSVVSQERLTSYSALTQNLGEVAEVIIRAPTEVKVGKLVIIDVSQSVGNNFEWMIVPETDDFLVIDKGRRAVFSSGVPGEFVFVIGCALNDSIDIKRHVVRVLGVTPPPLPDPINPQPPVGPLSTFSKKIDSWCTDIQSSTRSIEAAKLANAFDSVAAQIDAGALIESYDIITATTEANRAVLGDQLQNWITFLRALQTELEQQSDNGQLVTPAQHSVIWKEIAKGLRYFATNNPSK